MSGYPAKFEQFWSEYPRKVAKPAAAKAWEKQAVEGDMYLAQAAVDDVKKRTRLGWWSRDKTKIPHPSTWINARRWEDEGWEHEIGNDEGHTPVSTDYSRPAEPELVVPWYEMMLNRLGRNYILQAGGLPDDADRLADVKARILRDDVPAFLEEMEAEEIDRMNAGLQIGKLFLRHLDHAYGLTIGVAVYKKSLMPDNTRHKDRAA